MENQFIRHEPCFERILFVLTLDRKKMKERILIGEEQQIRFQLNGSQNAEVLCDMKRPLGTFLIKIKPKSDYPLKTLYPRAFQTGQNHLIYYDFTTVE